MAGLLALARVTYRLPFVQSTLFALLLFLVLDGALRGAASFSVPSSKPSSFATHIRGLQGADALTPTNQEMASSSSSSPHPKAAVVYLTSNVTNDLLNIRTSLEKYSGFAGPLSPYPIFIFHEGLPPGTEEDLISLAQSKGSDPPTISVQFFHVQLGPRAEYDPIANPPYVDVIRRNNPLGYGNMISFFLRGVFDHPAIRSLDYILRFDTDAYLEAEVQADLFKEMRERDALYAWKRKMFDAATVTKGLVTFAKEYLGTSGRAPEDAAVLLLDETGDAPMYYNNFEIVSVPFMLSAPVQAFVEAIMASDRVYTQRWGDAPIRYLQVHMFAGLRRTWQVPKCFISYCHHPMECG
jgi:hypothetical protein